MLRLLEQHANRFISLWARRASSSPSHYDICIVGGGIMGMASAFFLANKLDPTGICVIERDTTVCTYVSQFVFECLVVCPFCVSVCLVPICSLSCAYMQFVSSSSGRDFILL